MAAHNLVLELIQVVRMPKKCELHFQEGFNGETVTVAVDGKIRASFCARTRLQIGLARIEAMQLHPGQTVAIAVPELGILVNYQVGEGDQWITVNLAGSALSVQGAKTSPGYL